MASSSFDVTTGVDYMEVHNAVTQATKEITQRYDFKGLTVSLELDQKEHTITLAAPDEFKLKAIWDVLQSKLVRRQVPLKNMKLGEAVPAAGSSVRQVVEIQDGLTADMAREVAKAIKDAKMKKVQAAIQGDTVRISSPDKDSLQAAIALLKQQDLGVELKFGQFPEQLRVAAVPDIGVYHPQIVHFVIAFLGLGVVARVISLLPLGDRFRFVGPMASALLVLGTVASIAAVQSGTNAHGPVERVPGAREAVVEHEDWGKRARNVFIAIAVLELAALALISRRRVAHGLRVVSALAGLAGLFVLYEAGEHGGQLVYNHAGGVGIRSGDAGDVRRLLVAGLYHGARAARDGGRKDEAGRLTEELMRQMPEDANVRFLGVESLVKDRDDPRGALAVLGAIEVPGDDWRLNLRKASLTAEAYRALGAGDSAQAALDDLRARFPDHPRIRAALERMSRPEGGRR